MSMITIKKPSHTRNGEIKAIAADSNKTDANVVSKATRLLENVFVLNCKTPETRGRLTGENKNERRSAYLRDLSIKHHN